MAVAGFVAWLADTAGSTALRESLHLYPLIETGHVLTIALFVGSIAMVDLRLLGVAFRSVPVSELTRRILPWTVAGFVLMAASGLLLFYAVPVRTYHSVWFRMKLGFMVVAALNVWWFHRRVERDRARWDTAERPPLAARLSAAISLVGWTGVIVTGRMIAYNWFDCDRPQSSFIAWFAGCTPAGT
jgi:hypothetical protein